MPQQRLIKQNHRFISRLIIMVLFFSLAFGINKVSAQNEPEFINEVDTSALYKVTKFDGVFFIGKILKMDEREILMVIPVRGRLIIPLHEVKSIHLIHPEELDDEGHFIDSDKELAHYVLNANAQGIKKGEVELGLSWLGPDVMIGISDRKSLRINSTWIAAPVMVTYNYQIPISEKFNIGLGIMGGWASWIYVEEGLLVPYATITIGSARNNVSVSAGYGKYFIYNYDYDIPLLSISGINPLSSEWSIIFDSYLVQQEYNGYYYHPLYRVTREKYYSGMATLAFRWSAPQNYHLQFGGGVIGLDGDAYPLPVLQFLKKF